MVLDGYHLVDAGEAVVGRGRNTIRVTLSLHPVHDGMVPGFRVLDGWSRPAPQVDV